MDEGRMLGSIGGAMEHDDPMERGELVPLVNKICSRHCDNETSKEIQDESELQNIHYDHRAPAIILGFECFESTAFFGISANLVVYLSSVLHGSNASNAASVAIWAGTCYFTPLIGALIADTFLGNYNTILISFLVYFLGSMMITMSALATSIMLPSCEGGSCQSASRDQDLVFFFGLYLVAFGSGGIKSAVLPFGANQFDDKSTEEIERRSSFFSFFYLCLNVGVLIASTLIVWLQENVDWALGFGISTMCLAMALGGFLLGTPTYHLQTRRGSPLKSIVQVLIAAFERRRLEVPLDNMLLYEVDGIMAYNLGRQKLAHTDEFSFLDKAATISHMDVDRSSCSLWNLCTVTQVEELKILLRLLPIWISGVIYSAAYCQMATTFIQQGTAMNTKIRSFTIPPASLSCFEVVGVMAWVLFYNRVIVPLARSRFKNEIGLTQLQRIAIGQFLMILSMATAAFVEFRRLDSARAGETLSIAWQLLQYFIVAGSEVFCLIAQHELFYSEAPATMKSFCTSISLLAISIGSYLSSLIVTVVVKFTTAGGRPGWLPDDLNEGRMDYYFLVLTGLCTLNFAFYMIYAMNYVPKQVIVSEGR